MLLCFRALPCDAVTHYFSSRGLPSLQSLGTGCQHQAWLTWQRKFLRSQLFVKTLPVFLRRFPLAHAGTNKGTAGKDKVTANFWHFNARHLPLCFLYAGVIQKDIATDIMAPPLAGEMHVALDLPKKHSPCFTKVKSHNLYGISSFRCLI